jgi:RNA 3'-terminal phosphate cyclase (ATP)
MSGGLVVIDGSRGEGGGQMVRTSCALSLLTGRPVRVINVRANRKNPGLARQHATAVLATARIGGGEVRGATVGSREIELWPGTVTPGRYRFDIGSAGATSLVLQTLLLPLALAGGASGEGGGEGSALLLEGGTHNTRAPPYAFLQRAWIPILHAMAGSPFVDLAVERAGFYPRGGGRVACTIHPVAGFSALELLERGAMREREATATVWRLPASIADRELVVVRRELGWKGREVQTSVREDALGAGNELSLVLASEHVTEVVTGIGERGVPAETVAAEACTEAAAYLASGAPVGEHLADQLLLPMALGAGGTFRTVAPTLHTTTQIEVIRSFLDVDIAIDQESEAVHRVRVRGVRSG